MTLLVKTTFYHVVAIAGIGIDLSRGLKTPAHALVFAIWSVQWEDTCMYRVSIMIKVSCLSYEVRL